MVGKVYVTNPGLWHCLVVKVITKFRTSILVETSGYISNGSFIYNPAKLYVNREATNTEKLYFERKAKELGYVIDYKNVKVCKINEEI